MIMRYEYLSQHATVFQKCSGLTVDLFDQLVKDVLPLYLEAEEDRLSHRHRQRALGAGHPFELDVRDHLLLTVIWLRLYPIHEVLAYLFGISDSTVSRLIERVLPILEQSGRDGMRWPDPGKKRRRQLPDLLKDIPELTVLVDSFEQRVQRPPHDDSHYSGKKKQHTLKSQITVDSDTGRIVDVSNSVPGPTADITLLEASGLLEGLPEDVGLGGDLAYLKLAKLRQQGFSPRRKPRGKDRPPEDVLYNRAFSQFRIVVEQTIGQVRRFQSVTATDRNHRQHHSARVAAVAGLVNRLPRFALA
ncbi:MAG: transposase family protein [Anaerolineae bacterium]|nr:transposase family protein [Anaerolineae bacterium]